MSEIRPAAAQGIEAAQADETRSGSAVGESPTRRDAPPSLPPTGEGLPEEIGKSVNAAILAECGSPRICSVNGRVKEGIRCGPCERNALFTATRHLSAALARAERAEKALAEIALQDRGGLQGLEEDACSEADAVAYLISQIERRRKIARAALSSVAEED